jgi:hypothetical protein
MAELLGDFCYLSSFWLCHIVAAELTNIFVYVSLNFLVISVKPFVSEFGKPLR